MDIAQNPTAQQPDDDSHNRRDKDGKAEPEDAADVAAAIAFALLAREPGISVAHMLGEKQTEGMRQGGTALTSRSSQDLVLRPGGLRRRSASKRPGRARRPWWWFVKARKQCRGMKVDLSIVGSCAFNSDFFPGGVSQMVDFNADLSRWLDAELR